VTRHLGNVSTKIWCADDLGGAELLRGRFSDYSYDVHTHERACFALITRGAIRIRTRGTEVVARAGELFAIDADEPHAGWPIDGGGWSLRTLYVDVARLQALVGERDGRLPQIPALAGPMIRDSRLASLFRGVHSCSEAGGPSLKREERYFEFIARLFKRHTRGASSPKSPGREERAIRSAMDFLDHHLNQQVRLTDIADAAGLPPFRLFRAFERATGMSPHRYQRQARVRFAAGLIRLGQALGDAASAAGFADQAHMTRSFRSTLGVTPGTYRDAYLHRRDRQESRYSPANTETVLPTGCRAGRFAQPGRPLEVPSFTTQPHRRYAVSPRRTRSLRPGTDTDQ
jgi:AraC-like DNA-binding protein